MLERYKSSVGERFNIMIRLSPHGRGKDAIFSVHNVDKDSDFFAVVINVDMLSCAQASISIEDERIDTYLLGIGLKLVKGKIDSRSTENEKKELNYNNLININKNISQLESSQDAFRSRRIVQEDILGCLYKAKDFQATSKELVDYVWCNSDLLLEELFYLDKDNLISSPKFSKELIDKGGDNNRQDHTLPLLTIEGKKRYEKMIEDILHMNMDLKPFKNWVPFASNKKVFVAHRFNETKLVNRIKAELKKEDFGFTEGKVEDLGFITDDILNKIKESGFFLALITPFKEFKDEQFSTSSWILMEIGGAIAFKRNVLILAEDCIEQEEYARKLQAECQYEIFNREKDFDDKLMVAIDRIIKEWEKHRRK